MNYIQFRIPILNEDDSDTLIALFEDTHFLGCEQTEHELILYYPENAEGVPEVGERLNGMSRTFTSEVVKEENWNQLWESNFEPIVVENQIGIRAHFHEPFPHMPYEIVITPKMSFGTGHHATTRLMLTFMLQIPMDGLNVLDFGCGTGILAIYAKMKGAQMVLGTDNDPWCIDNSVENASNNGCEIQFLQEDLKSVKGPFHLILANINLNILKEYMFTMKNLLSPNGTILMSGILESDIQSLSSAIEKEGMTVKEVQVLSGWACLRVEKN